MSRRIAVKGTSGCGKSTFAAELARRLGVAHIELDALHHGPNWAGPTADGFRERVRAAMDANPSGWVIDGNYERKLGSMVTDAQSERGSAVARRSESIQKLYDTNVLKRPERLQNSPYGGGQLWAISVTVSASLSTCWTLARRMASGPNGGTACICGRPICSV